MSRISALFLGVLSGLLAAMLAFPGDPGAKLLQEVGPHVYSLTMPSEPRSGGTGFVVRAPGGMLFTLTNNHVCADAEDGILVAGPGGQQLHVIATDPIHDLCVMEPVLGDSGLRLSSGIVPYAALYAIGHPFLTGLSLSRGYAVGEEPGVGPFPTSIRSTLSIFPGNSGSPVLNEAGEVVGIISMSDTRMNYGLFIKLESVAEFLHAIETQQSIAHSLGGP